jgi:iron-regulated transporter 1
MQHEAVIPSFALSLLYFTVLSFSGQMLTYLLASGITLWQVGIIRGISTVFELSATWIAPRMMKHIGIVRTGMWSISWQMIWLAAGITWFFYYYSHGFPSTSLNSAAGLAAAVALSRCGLWGFDLSVQNIIQDVGSSYSSCWLTGHADIHQEVQGDSRASFSTVEAAFQNAFELLSWALTIIWSDANSFQWPAIISVAAVYMAGGLYAYFLRKRRGHLIHPPSCLNPKPDL